MSPPETPRAGRPAGTEETPERLIREELLKHLKLYRRCREYVEEKIKKAGSNLTTQELSDLMDLLLKGITQMSRAVITPPKDDKPKGEEVVDAAAILKEITGV